MDKREWRARAQRERAGLAVDSAAHCRSVLAFLDRHIDSAGYVVLFDAMPGEIDLGSLVAYHPNPESRYALTRTPEQGHTLTVHRYGCQTEQHRYGYRQPVESAPVLPDDRIAAVLVPALAFDRSGARLGRGKGYYDRFLGRLGPGVAFVGITGDYVVDELPSESFDVSMTHLALSTGVQRVPLDKAGPASVAGPAET